MQAFGETRLAVAFHRLLMPDGRTYRLDQFIGLNQIGDAGLRDQVNHHYLSTFGAAAAVGLISGLSQYLGSAGLGRRRRRSHRRHRRQRRRRDVAGHAAGDEPVSESTADDHDSRRSPREGVSHERSRAAGVRGAAPLGARSERRTPCLVEHSRRPWSSLVVSATPAHAQFVVIDPANLVQTILIAERTLAALRGAPAQYETILRMAQGLGNMDRLSDPDDRDQPPRPGAMDVWPAVDSRR